MGYLATIMLFLLMLADAILHRKLFEIRQTRNPMGTAKNCPTESLGPRHEAGLDKLERNMHKETRIVV